MSKNWDLQLIVAANKAAGGHYFSPDTLRFFGQAAKDFTVHHVEGRIFVYADTHYGWDAENLCSCAEFIPATGRTSSVSDERKKQIGELHRAALASLG